MLPLMGRKATLLQQQCTLCGGFEMTLETACLAVWNRQGVCADSMKCMKMGATAC